jgi:flagellar L-ring protein precursor FlgH
VKRFFWIFSVSMLASAVHAADINLDHYQPLVSDVKAYNIGEPIVVIVLESTTAEASAGTGVERNTSIAAGVADSSNSPSVGLGIDASDDGSGKTARRGKVATQLSAIITEVIPGGMLRVEGVQNIKINGEQQYVKIKGLVRQSDVSKGNTIYSYQLANVELEIAGDGAISSAQKKSIVFRILNWLGVL